MKNESIRVARSFLSNLDWRTEKWFKFVMKPGFKEIPTMKLSDVIEFFSVLEKCQFGERRLTSALLSRATILLQNTELVFDDKLQKMNSLLHYASKLDARSEPLFSSWQKLIQYQILKQNLTNSDALQTFRTGIYLCEHQISHSFYNQLLHTSLKHFLDTSLTNNILDDYQTISEFLLLLGNLYRFGRLESFHSMREDYSHKKWTRTETANYQIPARYSVSECIKNSKFWPDIKKVIKKWGEATAKLCLAGERLIDLSDFLEGYIALLEIYTLEERVEFPFFDEMRKTLFYFILYGENLTFKSPTKFVEKCSQESTADGIASRLFAVSQLLLQLECTDTETWTSLAQLVANKNFCSQQDALQSFCLHQKYHAAILSRLNNMRTFAIPPPKHFLTKKIFCTPDAQVVSKSLGRNLTGFFNSCNSHQLHQKLYPGDTLDKKGQNIHQLMWEKPSVLNTLRTSISSCSLSQQEISTWKKMMHALSKAAGLPEARQVRTARVTHKIGKNKYRLILPLVKGGGDLRKQDAEIFKAQAETHCPEIWKVCGVLQLPSRRKSSFIKIDDLVDVQIMALRTGGAHCKFYRGSSQKYRGMHPTFRTATKFGSKGKKRGQKKAEEKIND